MQLCRRDVGGAGIRQSLVRIGEERLGVVLVPEQVEDEVDQLIRECLPVVQMEPTRARTVMPDCGNAVHER